MSNHKLRWKKAWRRGRQTLLYRKYFTSDMDREYSARYDPIRKQFDVERCKAGDLN